MVTIPNRLIDLKTYSPGKSPEELMEQFGFDKVAVLWNNENNNGLSPKAKEQMLKTLEKSFIYPDPEARELRGLIANHVSKNIEHIAVDNGAESILNNIFKAFFLDGDELLTSDGTFVAVYYWAQANNTEVTKIPLRKDYSFDLEKILRNISNTTRAIYIANPNNPTGKVIPKLALRQFVEDVPEDVLIIIDEAYAEYTQGLDFDYANSIRFSKPNIITLRTFSKAYGAAGVRIGYAVSSPEIIEALNKVKLTYAPSILAQAAGIGALSDQNFLQSSVNNNSIWLSKFYEVFEDLNIKYIPSGGNFVMIDLDQPKKAKALVNQLMEQGVFVRYLDEFQLPNCIRITVGSPEDNQYFLEKLKLVYPLL